MEKPILQGGSSMVPYFPPEMMTEILAKCPVKILWKCRYVCKLWCSLISNHQFARKHLSRCASNTQRMILNDSNVLYDLRFHSVNDSMMLEETSVYDKIDYRRFCIMGSCDGLICLTDELSRKVLLWNPVTRESKMLPSFSEAEVVDLEETRSREWRYGFGYDCKGDDYKVLIFMPLKSVNHKVLTIVPRADDFNYKIMMYTLRTNSWRSIADSPLGIYICEKISLFVNGALHWKAVFRRPCIASATKYRIVSFDLTSETYLEVPLPQDVGAGLREVGAIKGCFCLLSQDIKDDSRFPDNVIWVMKEYGVPDSWTKTVRIPMVFGGRSCMRLMPMTWSVENVEILLNVSKKPASYNPNKDSLRFFTNIKEVRVRYPQCVGYEESLISPNVYSNSVANDICHFNIEIVRTYSKKDVVDKTRTNQSIRRVGMIRRKKPSRAHRRLDFLSDYSIH